jgi:hypothetical protein
MLNLLLHLHCHVGNLLLVLFKYKIWNIKNTKYFEFSYDIHGHHQKLAKQDKKSEKLLTNILLGHLRLVLLITLGYLGWNTFFVKHKFKVLR